VSADADAEPGLTPTSYLVLGLVHAYPGSTSYDLKVIVAGSIGYFWPFPHSQLYAEPARLVELGLLSDDRETTGRKRRRFTITTTGVDALERWLARPAAAPTEIRDLAVLQLFFGSVVSADQVRELAHTQISAHDARLTEYEEIAERAVRNTGGGTAHMYATLQLGLRFERAAIEFWREIAAGADEIAQGRLAAIGFPT
jgi:DNA-binding PadR family transcriptional regulator